MAALQTFSRKFLDLDNPEPDQIEEDDILLGLSRTHRFSGQTQFPWTVLQHSVMMGLAAQQLSFTPSFVRIVALHDAAEAFICDIPKPLKNMIPEYSKIEERVMEAIYSKYKVSGPLLEESATLLRMFDNSALWLESILFLNGGPIDSWHMNLKINQGMIAAMGPIVARIIQLPVNDIVSVWKGLVHENDQHQSIVVN